MAKGEGSFVKKMKKIEKAAHWEPSWRKVAETEEDNVVDDDGKLVELSVTEPKTKADRRLRFRLAKKLPQELIEEIVNIQVSNVCV